MSNNDISFITEYIYPDFPQRRYDFYLPEYNRLIEFDGIQHFKFKSSWHQTEEEYELAKIRDYEKNNYALQNNVPLVRIPYFERDNITLEMLLGDQYLIKEIENVNE